MRISDWSSDVCSSDLPGAVGENVVLGFALLQVDAIGAPREQVDGRRAEQSEVARIDRVMQAGDAAVEQHHDLERVAMRMRKRGFQTRELGKQETCRAGEIFLQQAIATERPAAVGNQRLVFLEALAANMTGVDMPAE